MLHSLAMSSSSPLIASHAALEDLRGRLDGVPAIGLDTEFLRERTYRAELCLLQLTTPQGPVCVDPLALGELELLRGLLGTSGPLKVLHAARQDLEVLAPLVGAVGPLFDTQVAAALAGHPAQVGYAELVRRLLERELPKAHTRTDWSRRPLAPEQIEYALDDVRYLLPLQERLTAEIESLGRAEWLAEELAALTTPAGVGIDPELAWQRFKGVENWDAGRLALLRALPDSFPEKCPELDLSGADRELMNVFPQLLAALESLPDSEEVKSVWRTILGAQIFDIERFPSGGDSAPAFPLSPEELSDYTSKVAGSVGEFWTRICFKKIPGYSARAWEEMLPLAQRFGQGLQLVNILRDRRADAARGRVYIPDERFYAEMQNAAELLDAGREYAAGVVPRLMRSACLLPLELGRKTLALVAEHPLGENLKVPRLEVWGAFLRTLFAKPS